MNNKKLRAELVLKGISLGTYAKILNINRATLYRKMEGKTQFTLDEIKKSRELFGFAEAEEIFFVE